MPVAKGDRKIWYSSDLTDVTAAADANTAAADANTAAADANTAADLQKPPYRGIRDASGACVVRPR